MKVSRWPLLSLLLPLLLAGLGLGSAPPAGISAVAPSPADFVSSPRESIPQPVHDEATCAFCQAAAFAPHASSPGCHLHEDSGSSPAELGPRDQRLMHSASFHPPRSRAPPNLRDG